MLLLTNFNVPVELKARFDAVCQASSRTRTSVLVELMERYVIDQSEALAERRQRLNMLDQTIAEILDSKTMSDPDGRSSDNRHRHVQRPGESNFEPLSAFIEDEEDRWA